jgi:hypothetical protein
MKTDLTLDEMRANMKRGMRGEPIRDGHTKKPPVGDSMINAFRNALWEAWEKGLDEGHDIYPSGPLLDSLTKSTPELDEPEL